MKKKVLITGGEGDLASFIKLHFQEQGDLVFSPGKEELDTTSSDSIHDFFKSHGPFQSIIINAGKIQDTRLIKMSESDWDTVIDVNLKGARSVAEIAKAYSTSEEEAESLSLFYISSYAASSPQIGQWNYATAKSYLIDLAKDQACRWGPEGVRVNVILPGFLRTKMTKDLPEKVISRAEKKQTLQRFNTPETVAKFIFFLDKEMPHTSGQVFNLDSRILPTL